MPEFSSPTSEWVPARMTSAHQLPQLVSRVRTSENRASISTSSSPMTFCILDARASMCTLMGARVSGCSPNALVISTFSTAVAQGPSGVSVITTLDSHLKSQPLFTYHRPASFTFFTA